MKKNSPAYPSFATCLIGAASTLASFQASAFQLGEIQAASHLGEPLAAQINVMMSPRETLLGTTLDVLPDFDYRNDPIMRDALKSITARLVRNQYGQHYIALTSTRDLNVPVLAFRLKAANGDNILIQRYSLSPPPALRPRAQPTVEPIGRRRNADVNQPTSSANTQASPITGNEYGPVKAGDTLWKIASRVVGKDRAGAILNELFELNPHAFINGDINKLKQGVTLTLPAAEGSSSIVSDTKAESPVKTNNAATAAALPQPTEAPVEPQRLTELSDDTADIATDDITADVFDDAIADVEETFESTTTVTATSAAVSETASLDWRTQNPELADKLNQLADKYAALRERYAEQSGTSDSEPSPGEGADAKTAFEQSLTANLIDETALDPSRVTINIEKSDASLAATTPETATIDVAPVEAETSPLAPAVSEITTTGPARFELPSWALMLLGLGLLLSAGGYFIYRARNAARRQAEQLSRREKDDSLKQELAKKAQHRISMEDEVERMLQEQVGEEDADEIEKTMQLHVDDLMSQQDAEAKTTPEVAAEDSAESRIDASISHGRYAEAEDLLHEVIANYPRNVTAKLRLAEVYYITEKIGDFVSISQDIHANHRPDISDEDWRRVMRMGKMIAPEQPPFSGPQSIMGDVSAG